MGVAFVHTKRFKMKASLLLAALVIYTCAEAAKIKAEIKGKARTSDYTPDCVQNNVVYHIHPGQFQVVERKDNIMDCSTACWLNPNCKRWSIYFPNDNCPSCAQEETAIVGLNLVKVYDCIMFEDTAIPTSTTTHPGFYS